ncbi:MAG: fumarylacetoacetate hydrolase family protein [Armatimonadaceae bacterium]
MKNIVRFQHPEHGARVGAVSTVEGVEVLTDLTALRPTVFASMASWLATDDPLEEIRQVEATEGMRLLRDVELLSPLDVQELWGAGVTYERSKVARMEESESGGDFYDKVYDAERPEIFFKATPRRVVAPGQPVRIRRDSTWDVPEPELTLVVSLSGKIVGYTVGNDMSSRSIEGQNPLYLPQAKTWDGCASVGPTIRLLDDSVDLKDLTIRLAIERGGATAFDEFTSTSRMRRTGDELVGFLFREATFPEGVFLMTGTGIVPPDDFTLASGDVVKITIGEAGTLVNPVTKLPTE